MGMTTLCCMHVLSAITTLFFVICICSLLLLPYPLSCACINCYYHPILCRMHALIAIATLPFVMRECTNFYWHPTLCRMQVFVVV